MEKNKEKITVHNHFRFLLKVRILQNSNVTLERGSEIVIYLLIDKVDFLHPKFKCHPSKSLVAHFLGEGLSCDIATPATASYG